MTIPIIQKRGQEKREGGREREIRWKSDINI
jgi:hypothetical protein